jgi:glycine betaine/proline transport system ATP-binding protein
MLDIVSQEGAEASHASAPEAAPIISVKDAVKVFGPRPEQAMALVREGRSRADILSCSGCTVAVRNVSIDIRAGELFVIMGLSGSGKSTLVRMLNRLVEPTAGSVEVAGRDIGSLTDRELRQLRNHRLGMVFQHFAVFPHRTVRENVGYGLHVRGATDADRRERVEWALETVGLAGWGDAPPGELSGGMKQRVGLARALATDAEVLLMDEPFSALDPLIRRDMQDLLLRLHHELHRTVVFVTHDLNEAMRIGDRVMLMKDGEVVQVGRGADILSSPADDYVSRFIADVDRSHVLTAKDVMHTAGATERIEDDLPIADPDMTLAELCGLFGDGRATAAAVVDGDRGVVGTVAVGAILEALAATSKERSAHA